MHYLIKGADVWCMHVVTGIGGEVCAEAEILSGAAGNTCKKVRLLKGDKSVLQ